MRYPIMIAVLALASAAGLLHAQGPQSVSASPATTGRATTLPAAATPGPASQLAPLRRPVGRGESTITLFGPRDKLNAEETEFIFDLSYYLGVDWVYETDESIRRFLLVHPDHLKAMLLRAIVVRGRLDPAPAKPLFEAVVNANKDSLEGRCAALMLDIDDRRHPTTSYRALATFARQNPDYHQIQWLYGIAAHLVHNTNDATQALSPVMFGARPIRAVEILDDANNQTDLRYLPYSLRNRQEAVKLAPAGWSYRALARTLSRLHKAPEAEQAAAKAAELDPKNVNSWITWAETLIHLKRYADAITKCQQALSLDPQSAEAAAIYGFALENSSQPAAALAQYMKAAGIRDFDNVLRPADEVLALQPAAARNEVLKYLSAGRQSNAETLATQLAEKHRADEAVQFMQAVLVRSRFNVTAATPFFRRVVALAPDSVSGRCATFMLNIDSRADAQKNFDDLCDLARLHPADAFVLWTAAIACRTLNCNLEGVEFYGLLCRQFSAGPALVHQTYGNVLMELDLNELALARRKITVQMEPATWSVDTLALTLGDLQFFEAADVAHAIVSRANPQNRQYWLNWAINLRWWGHHQDAIDKCQRMIALNPNDAMAYFEWGRNLEALGKPDEALAQYEAAMKADPTQPWAFNYAAVILDARGDRAGAAEIRRKAPSR